MLDHPYRTPALVLSLLTLQAVLPPVTPALASPAADRASLTISFTGLGRPGGYIMAGVFDSEAAFNGDRPVQGVRIPVTGPKVSQSWWKRRCTGSRRK